MILLLITYFSLFVGSVSSTLEMAATALATVGMAAEHRFSEMKKESETVFDLGPKAYWLTLAFNKSGSWQPIKAAFSYTANKTDSSYIHSIVN